MLNFFCSTLCGYYKIQYCFFFSSRRRHTRWPRDWSSDVCSSDLSKNRFCSPGSSRSKKSRSDVTSNSFTRTASFLVFRVPVFCESIMSFTRSLLFIFFWFCKLLFLFVLFLVFFSFVLFSYSLLFLIVMLFI